MEARFESPYWREVSRTCLTCGICSYLCPTCHCFDIVDEGYLRVRCWDTCSSDTFTSMACAGGLDCDDALPIPWPGTYAGTTDGAGFFEYFRNTLSYDRLSGAMRGWRRLLDDAILVRCFQGFIDLANHFSAVNPEARFHLEELEVNPFVAAGGRMAPLDGVCRFRPATPAREPRPVDKLHSLLQPRSAAVIGVSAQDRNMGRIILGNMLAAGFERERLTVVHPQSEAIDGVECVASIAELPEKVDLLVVAVGANRVRAVIDEVIDREKAQSVILIPGGIGEKRGSAALEAELTDRIRQAHLTADGGPLFLGGNSLGVISHPGRYDTMFIPDAKLPKTHDRPPSGLCFISQSGAFIVATLSDEPWLDPTYAISIGNQMDLTVSDVVKYIEAETDVEVFGIYVEGENWTAARV